MEADRAAAPRRAAQGSDPLFDDLQRAWQDLLPGLPPIDGWTISASLPDPDEIGQAYIDYMDIGEIPTGADEAATQPTRDIAEYRHRLNRARQRATRERLRRLIVEIDVALPTITRGVDPYSKEALSGDEVEAAVDAVAELERLLGDAVTRQGRWDQLHRHLAWGQGQDWHDITELDWPSVKSDIESVMFAETDPLPVPDIDLGHAASGRPTGSATISLPWSRLDDDGFERLLYDLLRSISEYQNVQWRMQTRAPDRGRDLSLERVISDSTGSVRTERVIVQAKHRLTKSVRPSDIGDLVHSEPHRDRSRL